MKRTPKPTSVYDDMPVKALLAERAKLIKEVELIDKILRSAAEALGSSLPITKFVASVNRTMDKSDPTSITIPASAPVIKPSDYNPPFIPQLNSQVDTSIAIPFDMDSTSAEIEELTANIKSQLGGF